ncbi:hypothetical protein LEP1GSC198_2817, partial [Leptospira kirschneri str. JB]
MCVFEPSDNAIRRERCVEFPTLSQKAFAEFNFDSKIL